METNATQLTQSHPRDPNYSAIERTGLLCLGLLLMGLLAVASWLTPNPAGLGTHTQLRLPGCTMHTLFRIRCPGCGMTTSWAHAMNGDLIRAIQSNVGGVLLCYLSAAVFPCLLWMAMRGKSIPGKWFSSVSVTTLLIAIAISIAEWLIRLAF